jgi:dipeptide/tripeptide permease
MKQTARVSIFCAIWIGTCLGAGWIADKNMATAGAIALLTLSALVILVALLSPLRKDK